MSTSDAVMARQLQDHFDIEAALALQPGTNGREPALTRPRGNLTDPARVQHILASLMFQHDINRYQANALPQPGFLRDLPHRPGQETYGTTWDADYSDSDDRTEVFDPHPAFQFSTAGASVSAGGTMPPPPPRHRRPYTARVNDFDLTTPRSPRLRDCMLAVLGRANQSVSRRVRHTPTEILRMFRTLSAAEAIRLAYFLRDHEYEVDCYFARSGDGHLRLEIRVKLDNDARIYVVPYNTLEPLDEEVEAETAAEDEHYDADSEEDDEDVEEVLDVMAVDEEDEDEEEEEDEDESEVDENTDPNDVPEFPANVSTIQPNPSHGHISSSNNPPREAWW
ncbi:MAG: hypothetical protein M1837_002122 [Sclerophora amabilis]|nr:MAG: hypothetical protein M1837_002122 [Sclerophora amabilis]